MYIISRIFTTYDAINIQLLFNANKINVCYM